MANDRPAFLRPFELTATKICDVTCGGAGGTTNAVNMTVGVYSNGIGFLIEFVDALNAQLSGDLSDGDIVVSTDEDLMLTFANIGTPADCTIAWSNDDAKELLGFSYNIVLSSAITSRESAYRLGNSWIPDYCQYDQQSFYTQQEALASGMISQEGMFAGTIADPEIYYREYSFAHIPAENIFISRATNQHEIDRCLETFSKQSRTVDPSDDTYPTPRGFFCVYSVLSLVGLITNSTTNPLSLYGAGGITNNFTSAPDVYVFCSLPPSGIPSPVNSASIPSGVSYYNVMFPLNTAIDACPIAEYADA